MQYIGQQNRAAQDAFMMFKFLRDLLTSDACAHVTLEPDKYLIGPDNTANGPCFLKALLIKFHVEMNATDYHLRTQLITLPQTIATLHSNVALFNAKVTEITNELAAGGQTSSDLLVYLFQAYLKVEDKDFLDFIKMLKMCHDSGIEQLTSQQLMDQALVRYNQEIQDGMWKTKTVEQEQLIALAVQLKDANNKIADLQKAKSEPAVNTSTSSSGSQAHANKRYPAWCYAHDGQETTKTINRNVYYWCEHHKSHMWVHHKPDKCKAKQQCAPATAPPPQENRPPAMALQLTQALTAIAEGNESTEIGVTFE